MDPGRSSSTSPLRRATASRRVAAARTRRPPAATASGRLATGTSSVFHPVPPAGQAHGQHAPHGLDLAVQGELAHHGHRLRSVPLHDARRGQDPQGDRQVEGRALLAEAGRPQVDGDAVAGEGQAGIPDGCAHALPALPHGGVRQAHRGEGREPAGDVDLDADEDGLDPEQRGRQDAREHGRILRGRCPGRQRRGFDTLGAGCRRPSGSVRAGSSRSST